MTIDLINLGKLLKFSMLNPEGTERALRREAYDDRRRLEAPGEGGGDFHAPFWSDAKAHVISGLDLHEATDDRIVRNYRRARLYPLLRDQFIEWWQEFQRSTNETLMPLEESVHARKVFDGLGVTVKVDNLLAFQLGEGRHRLIYPYFSEAPALTDRWARIGLWLMSEALPAYSSEDMVLLDVHRARSFSVRSVSFTGGEEADFSSRMMQLRHVWDGVLADQA